MQPGDDQLPQSRAKSEHEDHRRQQAGNRRNLEPNQQSRRRIRETLVQHNFRTAAGDFVVLPERHRRRRQQQRRQAKRHELAGNVHPYSQVRALFLG